MGPALDGCVGQVRVVNACAAVRALIAMLGLIAAPVACSSEPRLSTMSDAGVMSDAGPPSDSDMPADATDDAGDGGVPDAEDCGAPGDEDGNGVADCDDAACVAAPACTPACGNAIVELGEQCDDGGHRNGDGCDSECRRSAYTYIKASNTGEVDFFGASIAISADGSTLAVGASRESSAATGVNGDQQDDSAPLAGAVYVLVRDGDTWVQQAYLKGSAAPAFAQFGWSVALSADGSTLAVGAPAADPDSTPGPGAAYVFKRTGSTWAESIRIGPSDPNRFDRLGWSVALSGDGLTLAVGATADASSAIGIDGDPTDASMPGAGAVHVYRAGDPWRHQAYIKASNTWRRAGFGYAVALSGDGSSLVVGAPTENSDATGIGGEQTNHRAPSAGAVYAFTRAGTAWAQQEYIKGSNTARSDSFGWSVALSSDARTLAVGAIGESSAATGVNGDQSSNAAPAAGAAYVFSNAADTWSQQAYVKASNTTGSDLFGWSVALSADGSALAVGAEVEDSASTGLNGEQHNNNATAAGAVFRYIRTSSAWHQAAYIKASNTGAGDAFGACLALSADGTLAVGAFGESSDATGIDGDQDNDRAGGAGAVYVVH